MIRTSFVCHIKSTLRHNFKKKLLSFRRRCLLIQSIIHIFLLNLLNDIDNVLIIAALIRKYEIERHVKAIYSLTALTLSRFFYVMAAQQLSELPGLRLISAAFILWSALRMIHALNNESHPNQRKSKKKYAIPRMVTAVVATDFVICLDNILMTAQLSKQPIEILVGIFLSLFIVFMLFGAFSEIFNTYAWVQIIAAGLMSQVAVLSLARDPLIKAGLTEIKPIIDLENAAQWFNINIFAMDVAILIIIIGILRFMKHKN